MPRPSLKSERTQEILDAFAVCVGRYGLEGATLERIAETAGVKRPILRHYLGNRDEMVAALIEHLGASFDAQTDALLGALPAKRRIESLFDILFAAETVTEAERVAAMQAMVAAADRYPTVRPVLLGAVDRLLSAIEEELAAAYPAAEPERVSAAAFGLVSLYFNLDALAPLRLPAAWRGAARQAAETLVQSLKENGDD